MTRGPRLGIWYWGAFAALMCLWGVVAIWLAPALIRDAYRGDSVTLLNDMITGQVVHSVDSYLSDWEALARRVTIGLWAGGIGLFVGLRNRGRLTALRVRLIALLREALAGLPRLPAANLVILAAWVGIAAGLTEVAVRFLRASAPNSSVYPELVWTAPLGAASTLLLVTGLLLLAERASKGRISRRLVAPVTIALAVCAIVRSFELGVHSLAVALLALGIAFQTGRLIDRRPVEAMQLARRSTPWLAGAIVGWAVAIPIWTEVREEVVTARLPSPPADASNVLLIILDTVRAASLSAYGYERQTTPELDKFASRATLYERAVSTAPWTLPGHGSIFTGRYHHELSTDWEDALDDAHPTIAEKLADLGYRTAGFVANLAYASTASGLQRGFARYEDHPFGVGLLVSGSWLAQVGFGRLWGLWIGPRQDPVRKTAERVNRDFLDWLHTNDDRPFFAFLNYFDAHDPYLPPEPYNLQFSETRIQPRYWWSYYREHSDGELAELRDAYDSSIYYLDRQLGVLFRQLESRGLLQNTLVIITSDHGEELGEQSPYLVGHGNSLYWPSLQVPLIILAPGRLPSGRRVSRPVSIRDIPATVMDFVAGQQDKTFPGGSLVRYPQDSDSGGDPSVLLSQVNKRSHGGPEWPASQGQLRSVLRGRIHYIVNATGVEEVYDVDVDPWEQSDLSDTPSAGALLPVLRTALDSALRATDSMRARLSDDRR